MTLVGCAGPFATPEAEKTAHSLYATYQVVDSRNNRHNITLVRFYENRGKSVLTLNDDSSGNQILYYIVATECDGSAAPAPAPAPASASASTSTSTSATTVAASLTCLFYPNPDDKYPPLGGQNFGAYPPFGSSHRPDGAIGANPSPFNPPQYQYRELNAQDFRSYPLAMPGQRTTFTLTAAKDMTIVDNAGQYKAFLPMRIENGYYLTVIGENPTLHLALKRIP